MTGSVLRIHLAARPTVPDRTESESELRAAGVEIEPAVTQRHHQLTRVVHETVSVVVHGLEVAVDVAEHDRAPFAFIVHLQGADDVEVGLGVVHHGGLHEEWLLVGGLAVLHIDLAGHRLHAVDDGGDALGDLDALQPLPRHVVEPERGRQAAHHRPVLDQHLGVDAVLAQEADLARTGNRIEITDRDTRRILETLRQVAAGHLAKARRRDDFRADVLALG